MWEVTLIKKTMSKGEKPFEYEEKITFIFDDVVSVTNFIETALKTTTNKVEVNVKYLKLKEGEE